MRHDFADWLRGEVGSKAYTVDAYLSDLRAFDELLDRSRPRHLSETTDVEVLAFLQQQRQLGRRPTTVYRQLVAIRRFFEWAISSGAVTCVNPTDGLNWPAPERPLPRTLPPERIDHLLSGIEGRDPLTIRDRAMLELACRCGLAENEIVSLTVSQLQLSAKDSTVSVTSALGRTRTLPMTAECARSLLRYLRDVRQDLIDPDFDTDVLFLNFRGHPLSRMGYWKILQKWAGIAGFKKRLRPSTLRHSFAVKLLRSGATLQETAAMLGHASINTTLIYFRCDIRELEEQIQRFHPRGGQESRSP